MPPPLNQGDKPICAAHAISQIAEFIIFKETGRLVAIDEQAIYDKAKQLDGILGDGTSLQAAIQAAFYLGAFAGKPIVEPILGTRDSIKRAIHKYCAIYAGFNITDSWFKAKSDIPPNGNVVGGHACIICGYGPDGCIIQNSWGPEWGCNGFAQLSWAETERQWLGGIGIKVV